MARRLIHVVMAGALLTAMIIGLRSNAPVPAEHAPLPPATSLDWTLPLRQTAPTFWGVWQLEGDVRAALPSALQGVRAAAMALYHQPQCRAHVRLLCLDATAATLAADALDGIIAMAMIEHHDIPWLTPAVRSIRMQRTAQVIDLTMRCTTPLLKTLWRELHIL